MKRIAVFCSGFGSNLQALINAVKRGTLRAQIALVAGDRIDAYALVRARKNKIPVLYADPARFPDRNSYDRFILRALKKEAVDLIVLAGYMRLVGPAFVKNYRGRILNIHPSLLPSFKGTHGIRDAFEYGVKVTGVTVHFVDEKLDHGPIVLQGAVEIKNSDTEEKLARRIHRLEHVLYPRAVQLVLSGKARIAGRKVKICA